jgi:SAM-dependent methyltransferase
METAEYENIYNNESSHFYYVSLHSIVISLINKFSNIKNPTILDAGCGTGLLVKKLSKIGKATGIDLSKDAISFAKKRNTKVQIGSVTDIPFNKNTFDIVTSMDVINLTEVTNDKKALAEIYRVLKPGGILILRASAIPWLSSGHDKWVHIKKRYNKNELENLLKKSGFKIQKISFMNCFLFVPALIKHIFWSLKPNKVSASGVNNVPTFINQIMIFVMKIEELLLQYIDIPLGNGLIAVCKKPLKQK